MEVPRVQVTCSQSVCKWIWAVWLLSQILTLDQWPHREYAVLLQLSPFACPFVLPLPHFTFHALTPPTSAQLPPGTHGGGRKYLAWESGPSGSSSVCPAPSETLVLLFVSLFMHPSLIHPSIPHTSLPLHPSLHPVFFLNLPMMAGMVAVSIYEAKGYSGWSSSSGSTTT